LIWRVSSKIARFSSASMPLGHVAKAGGDL
jgi:hypothetical protein